MIYFEQSDKYYFKLFACCRVVKGFSQSIICDTQKNAYTPIPNPLGDLILSSESSTIEEIKIFLENKFDAEVDNFFTKLCRDGWGFFTSEPNLFESIETVWHTPLRVSNAIFDWDSNSCYEIKSALQQLDDVDCIALQLRFFSPISGDFLDNILQSVKMSKLQTIEIYFPESKDNLNFNQLSSIIDRHLRVTLIVTYNSNVNESQVYKNSELVYTTDDLTVHHCGIISPLLFSSDISTFMESNFHNTCLNRKVSIDTEGWVKNCPSMKETFGNIASTKLLDVINNKDFTKYWNINKDKIHVCKDCEFRYICTDCRAYIEDPEDMFSKPLKCGYNPYSNEWSDWTINPLKQVSIDYFGLRDLVKNRLVP